jgi:hypothetical protein
LLTRATLDIANHRLCGVSLRLHARQFGRHFGRVDLGKQLTCAHTVSLVDEDTGDPALNTRAQLRNAPDRDHNGFTYNGLVDFARRNDRRRRGLAFERYREPKDETPSERGDDSE